jgi:hypothetical protein
MALSLTAAAAITVGTAAVKIAAPLLGRAASHLITNPHSPLTFFSKPKVSEHLAKSVIAHGLNASQKNKSDQSSDATQQSSSTISYSK